MKNLQQEIKEYLEERGWDKIHPGDLAKSIVIEGAELLEIFQWQQTDKKTTLDADQLDRLKKELADVLIYSIEMGIMLNLDLEQVVKDKLAKVKAKYPVELFNKRTAGKQSTRDLYTKVKQSYRREGKN